MINSPTCIFLTGSSTAEKVDEALIISVKFMVDFVTFCSSKTVESISSSFYVLLDLTSTIPTTSTDYISLEWIQFRSNNAVFYFSSAFL